MLNIYRLVREGGVGYDEVKGFVIVAATESQARLLAKINAADEGKAIWDTVPCELIGTTVTLGEDVVLKAFNPG